MTLEIRLLQSFPGFRLDVDQTLKEIFLAAAAEMRTAPREH